MKKILVLLAIAYTFVVAVSCETKDDVKSEIRLLNERRSELRNEVASLNSHVRNLKIESERLTNDVNYKNALANHKPVKYILRVKLKQSHFSLDVGDHIKDAMNAIEFDIPVDKEFYDHCSEGTELVDEFRMGSFIMNGKFGDWKMKVVSKRIQL